MRYGIDDKEKVKSDVLFIVEMLGMSFYQVSKQTSLHPATISKFLSGSSCDVLSYNYERLKEFINEFYDEALAVARKNSKEIEKRINE